MYDVIMVKKVEAPFGDKLIVGSVLLCFQVNRTFAPMLRFVIVYFKNYAL